MDMKELRRWLVELRTYLAGLTAGQHLREIHAMVDTFAPHVHAGRTVIASPLLADPTHKWMSHHRVYLSELNRLLQRRFGAPGHRFVLKKPRHGDYLLAEPYWAPVAVRTDLGYQHLTAEAEAHPSKHALLIQHSAATCRELLRTMLRTGTDVELYLQHPAACVCRDQSIKVDGVIRDLQNLLSEDVAKPGRLQVFVTRAPMSARVVRLDHLLAVGWYTYHQLAATITRKAGLNLKGDNRPMVVAETASPHGLVLDEMVSHLAESLRRYAGKPLVDLAGEVHRPTTRPRAVRPRHIRQ